MLVLILSGCATELYYWGSYESHMYDYLKDGSSGQQITEMEKDRARLESSGKHAAPGFYAHLGMLYAEAGDDYSAINCYETERTLFPESAGFMGVLLARYGR